MACWDSWYLPKDTPMYRVYVQQPEDTGDQGYYPRSQENCREWQNLTSHKIPIDDIYKVVYKMSLDDFEIVYKNKSAAYDNKFIQWITKRDTTILEFLLLAKNNEHVRSICDSEWYYPSMNMGTRMSLDDLAEKALSVHNVRLRDRYLLQAVRALTTMCRYDDCIRIWDDEASRLPKNNLMRKLIEPYIEGAKYHVKMSERSIEYFAEIGDVSSMLYCSGQNTKYITFVEAIEMVCEYAPNSHYIEESLQSLIRTFEVDWKSCNTKKDELPFQFDRLYQLCLKMASGGKSNNPAIWYYTAAFLADYKNEPIKASYLLNKAENCKTTKLIRESIKLFRIYLDAKLMPYNKSYEKHLYGQLKWLDSMIVHHIDDNVRYTVAQDKMSYGVSFYYWNDMMRKILLTEVCPRMLKAGNTTRALQLANMADNRLINIVSNRGFDIMEGKEKKHIAIQDFAITQYRKTSAFNFHDYSNHFFELIDSLDVNDVVAYVQRVQSPHSDFDCFLNTRNYTNRDYLYDIAGTHFLRHMRYREAMKYLSAVSETYKRHQNVFMQYDPFNVNPSYIKQRYDFKYQFAKTMYSLERSIYNAGNLNTKAMLMFRYAIGIRNSFSLCWSLTHFYKGRVYWGRVCKKQDWEHDEYTKLAASRVDQFIKLACEVPTDEETIANIHKELHNYKTLVELFPETEAGKLVRGACDNLHDYHAERIINPPAILDDEIYN